MCLHGIEAQLEDVGDFLVRPALCHELKNLTLAGGQKIVAIFNFFVAYLANVVFKQHLADHGTEERFPFRYSPDCANQICVRGVLKDVGAGSRLERAKDVAFIRMHTQDHDIRSGLAGDNLLSRLNSIQLRHADIKNRDLRVLLRNELNGFPSIGGFRHNFEVRLLLQQEPQPGSNDRVVVSEQYANLSHARLPARPEYCIHVWNSEAIIQRANRHSCRTQLAQTSCEHSKYLVRQSLFGLTFRAAFGFDYPDALSFPMTFKDRLRTWVAKDHLRQYEDKVLLVLTLVIGAIVGLVIASFILVTENLGARMYPAGGAPWRRFTIPVLGSLMTGVLLYKYFPNARGSGIPQTKAALFLHDGFIRLRTVLGKFGLSSVSLASGISLGREGPSVHVGVGIASVLGRWLGLGPSKVRALVPIGASAALAAAFNTPVAAVLFTLEEVMGDMHAPVLGSIVLSSATSWIVLHLVLGDEPLFHVPPYQLVHPLEFLVYAALGVVGGLVSVCFVKLLLWQRKYFRRMAAWGQALQPVVGGLLVGVLGWFVPDVLGVGYSHVSEALNSQLPLRLMVLLVVLKLVATVTCYASGNAGGIFGPSLFIGAMMGGVVGGTAHSLLPDYTGSAGAYALVGMGAAFVSIIRVPLTSVIMIFEVTRDYSIIVPLMIANLISFFISQRLQPEPIYEALQHQDGIHLPAGGRDREVPLLVRDAAHPPQEVLKE